MSKKQLAHDIEEQLDILVTSAQTIRDSLYEGVERDIKTASAFLKERFVANEEKPFWTLSKELIVK